ncbi:hypothetical protein SDC9_158321 [bioreactor metagenome]|uniref:DUF3048 domain-containing protein n=1 Tax=bioreactor metagenome TaxID=1076179 RepID=A0A645FBS7_9ZZZZ
MPHVTLEGGQISVTNILILYDEKYYESTKTINFRLNTGKGLLITGGTSRPVKWSRTADSLRFTEENGNQLNMIPGKTYICLTDNPNESRTVLS